jgi:hypothetical protein
MTHWKFIDQYVYRGMKAERQTVLFGIPANHPSEKNLNCKMINSSRVIKVNTIKRLVETKHTVYELVGPRLNDDQFKGYFQ